MELLQLTHCSRLKRHETMDALSREEQLRIAASKRLNHILIVTTKVTLVNLAQMRLPQFLAHLSDQGIPVVDYNPTELEQELSSFDAGKDAAEWLPHKD